MRPLLICLTLVLLFLSCGDAYGTERVWHQYATTHFSVLTAVDDPRARDIPEILERFRAALLETEWKNAVPSSTVELVLCTGEAEFEQYRKIPGSFAYYVHRAGHDFIVVENWAPRIATVLQHEFMHAVLQHTGIAPPLWLEEGMAQVYSSAAWNGPNMIIGGELNERPSNFDLRSLIAHGSTGYPESDRLHEFYRTSWAFTHMLMLAPKYRPSFGKFLTRIGQGASTDVALMETYGTDIEALRAYLMEYMNGAELPTQIVFAPLSVQERSAITMQPSAMRVQTTLAYLGAYNPASRAISLDHLQSLLTQHQQSSELLECLGFLAYRADRRQDAVRYFTQALVNGSRNTEMVLLYAHLAWEEGIGWGIIAHWVREAAQWEPSNQDVLFLEGQVAAQTGQYDLALDAMQSVQTSDRRRQYVRVYTIAYCALNLSISDLAREYALRAQQCAANPEESEKAAALVRATSSKDDGLKSRRIRELSSQFRNRSSG